MERVIVHLDMDAFFASIEQLDHPELRGRPVIVGSPAARGVVAAASYEARRFGVHSAMPSVTAQRLCPDAAWVSNRRGRYVEMSAIVMEVLGRFAPIVDPVSIDEASCDITGTKRLLGDPVTVATRMKEAIRETTGGLTGSVGMGPNRFVAKLASDMEKPDGLVWIPRAEVISRLHPLPIRRVWGVGPKSEKRFRALGIDTIGKLARTDGVFLDEHFGQGTSRLLPLVRGEEVPLGAGHERKSVSAERTFIEDIADPEEVEAILRAITEEVARRLRKGGFRGRAVTLKVRFGDFTTFTRSHTLPHGTFLAEEILPVVFDLLDKVEPLRPVRLLGVGVSGLADAPEPQLDLFAGDRTRREHVAEAMDELNRKFGRDTVAKASLSAIKSRREDDGL